jgi:hypothetical protein
MFKIPIQIANSIIKKESGQELPKILYNKSAPYIKLGADFMSGQDRLGNPNIFTSTDRFGRKVPLGTRAINTAGDISRTVMPPFVKGATDLVGGNGLERSVAQAAQLPIQYTYPKAVKGPSFMRPPVVRK